ncbi:MAG: molybdopterin-dependent oxidoreductase [Deltaproteobacteria bacterium]|jgi:isoquinoline 1-oxidoreductase subunit beta|nr:molybdopterin-dependent oxidoreductase [Deltaproteobacteria bacterium]MBT4266562.1 molybdopterin-dependent oxidoreductase [Deltaproteobacteria bacterium]MBT4639045.1 molybdopterin-dependent oxidoreductase [Deltaproteobacteria bacterium]MBT6500277.1 molybdopterin-dependent oxidoreductase [Deltaproteobacteria bacterium]MBT6611226.1 molybdopterin-dependent oxidoreductase [Deltaproteobacteria bacterium]
MEKSEVNQSRRRFLKISTATGSVLIVGIQLPNCSGKTDVSAATPDSEADVFTSNAWKKIHADNTITVMVSHSEMGQGITTALPMIVAQELDADWAKIRFEMAPVGEDYKHPLFGVQWTVFNFSGRTPPDIIFSS